MREIRRVDEMIDDGVRDVPSWHDPDFDDNLDGTRHNPYQSTSFTRGKVEDDLMELLDKLNIYGEDNEEEGEEW